MPKKPKAPVPGVAIIIPAAKGGMKTPAKPSAKKGCRK